jgi:hypothetical protein
MNIFLVNKDNLHSQSLCEKLSKAKDGSITQLTDGEMDLYDSPDFQHLNYGNSAPSNIVEVKRDGSYIFVCDVKTNTDDVMAIIGRLNLDAGIIRVF